MNDEITLRESLNKLNAMLDDIHKGLDSWGSFDANKIKTTARIKFEPRLQGFSKHKTNVRKKTRNVYNATDFKLRIKINGVYR